MENLTNIANQLVGHLSAVIQGFLAILIVALILTFLNKFLQRAAGHRFRNQTLMLGATFLGVLLVILMMPIDTETRGQLLQLTGIIISAAVALSSGTFIANAMAGIMLKSVRNFHTGDWVETDGVFGRVSERGLFHTEIQTPDRDLTTLPNLLLATKAVKVVRQSGTIVDATVSLGYDVHHSRCEKLLLKAAQSLELQDPFVQVLDLGDYSVTYRVAGLLKETKQVIAFRSRLRVAILDHLHSGGVEIVSPLFNNQRQVGTDQVIIPQPVRESKKRKSADAAPVDVVFDKAEEAEGLSTLQFQMDQVEADLKSLKKEGKGLSGAEKAAHEATTEELQNQLARLKAEVEAAEAPKEGLPPNEA